MTPEIKAALKALERDILKQRPKKEINNSPYSTNDWQLPGSIWFIHQ